jgi:hypothetical protein
MAPSDPIRRRIRTRLPAHGADQVTYAAAFIHPAVVAVDRAEDGWEFTLGQDVDPAFLQAGLETLIARFDAPPPESPEPEFALHPPPEAVMKEPTAWLGENGIVQEIHPGLYVFREPLSTVIRFLDDAILRRFANPFGAREETYPNCIPVDALGRTDHFVSFPEHLHFLSHLTQDLGVLDRFAARARQRGPDTAPAHEETSGFELAQNPSTCYHCYAARAGTEVADNIAVTAITKCHRFEAANHREPGRLLEFSLREVIFLGDGAYMRESRQRTLELVAELARDWRIYGTLEASNDPFFTSDYEVKAAHQRRMAMKFEYRAVFPGVPRGLAIMSSNLHGPAFSKAFNMTRRGRVIQTGCLGFGHERLALVLVAQHGPDAEAWPAGLKADYAAWKKRDPMAR